MLETVEVLVKVVVSIAVSGDVGVVSPGDPATVSIVLPPGVVGVSAGSVVVAGAGIFFCSVRQPLSNSTPKRANKKKYAVLAILKFSFSHLNRIRE